MTVFACLLTAVSPAEAGVNLKNGNFYVTYTDVSLSGPMELQVTRTYNSQSHSYGMFGNGWGCSLETNLQVRDDGSILIHENGIGATNHFDRPKIHAFTTADASGSLWFSSKYGRESILRTNDGYHRSSGDRIDVFDSAGRLVRIKQRRGRYYIELVRDANGRLLRLEDTGGQTIDFTYNAGGQVEAADVNKGQKRATYLYHDKQLIYGSNTGGHRYWYEYGSSDNMVRIRYLDGSHQSITYDGRGFARSVQTNSGHPRKLYEYFDLTSTQEERAYATQVSLAGSDDPDLTRYEYHFRVDAAGDEYKHRTVSLVRGINTDITYDEAGNQISIKRGDRETKFKYNSRDLLTFKDDGRDVVEIEYHPSLDKMTKVTRYPSGNPGLGETSTFDYNGHGELTRGVDPSGNWVELRYDDQGRITTMDSKSGVMRFVHNEFGKPVRIELDGVGAITVEYDQWGEISKVDSEEGHAMALKVTQAFQNLLSIVKPAGVNLGI